MENKDVRADGTWQFRLPPRYNYKPQKDITAYELAVLLPIILTMNGFEIEELPQNLKKNFKLIE